MVPEMVPEMVAGVALPFGEELQGTGDSRAVEAVEGDGLGGLFDAPAVVEQVARDGPVFVRAGEVGA